MLSARKAASSSSCAAGKGVLSAMRLFSAPITATGGTHHSALSAQVRSVADAHSGASIVIVDPERAAAERNRIARGMLTSNLPQRSANQRFVLTWKDIIHTVPYSISIVVEEEGEAAHAAWREKVEAVLTECFEMVDKHLNHFNADSEISKVNHLPVHEKHLMSPHLRKVMACCVEVYRISGSCFDPAASPLGERLRELASSAKEGDATNHDSFTVSPEDAELFTLPNSFGIDLQVGTIHRRHARATLDLGGLNKGYTVDCVVEKLNAMGCADVLFEWGGDCRASGLNVQRLPWAVGIVRPPSVENVVEKAQEGDSFAYAARNTVGFGGGEQPAPELLRVVALRSEALCTSGDYENIVYNHVTGQALSSTFDWQNRQLITPSNNELAQVSVKCYSCMYADALATASLIKRDTVRVRYMLEHYRRDYNRVTDYAAYTREGERLAHMYEIAKESPELRADRIASSLPARVIIVGGGLAGQAAAIEAANCGAQVILLEKEARLGGNSAKATSGINGHGTRAQAEHRVVDNCQFFERDTYLSGVGGTCDPGLVRALSVKSADAIEWLGQFGIPLTVLSQLGGASRKRCHRAPDTNDGVPVPIGFTIMQHLEQHIRTNLAGRVTILNETAASELLYDTKTLPDGNKQVIVRGVKYRDMKRPESSAMELSADAVVLATGGFSNDQSSGSLLREYAPQLFGTPTTNGTFATGDGVKMARKLGASLVDMDKVQLHPTGLIDPKDPANRTKYLGPEALRGSGGILLNKNGERFINELDLRSVVSQAIIAQDNEFPGSDGSKFSFCVLNEAAAKLFGINSLTYYWKTQGLFTRVESIEELAKMIGCSRDSLFETLDNYEHLSSSKTVCPLTGKMVYPCVVGPKGPYYVAYVTPSIHYTMGGCLISSASEVLHGKSTSSIFDERQPILGLFGAGEVTGGVHGRNRLGGNSLLECVVFGKIAGDRASTILQREKTALSFDKWAPVVLRESRAGDQFGVGSRVLRFNLPGAMQTSGLSVGQFVGIRGDWDGQQLIGYYSPITLPDDRGRISLLVRGDKGNLREWINNMRPGDSVEMKACGGLKVDLNPIKKQITYNGTVIRKMALIAGGSGVAPMLQLIRASLNRPYVDGMDSVRMIYAAEDEIELTYRELLRKYAKESPDKFRCHFVLNNPPEGWTAGCGYVDTASLQKNLQPPSKDLLVAICGPPVMQRSIKSDLAALGYSSSLVHTIDENVIL